MSSDSSYPVEAVFRRFGMKTLEQFKQDLDDVVLAIRDNFIRLGEKLYEARSALSAEDYDNLLFYVEKQGIRRSDQRAATAAFLFKHPSVGVEFDHRIDPCLVFAGAKNSKVLAMDKEDQQRLLSNEKFEILQPSGRSEKKTWVEMTDHERNTLIGKGGKIRTISEQRDSRKPKANITAFPLGSTELASSQIRFISRDGLWHLHSTKENFAEILGPEGRKALMKAFQEADQATGLSEKVG